MPRHVCSYESFNICSIGLYRYNIVFVFLFAALHINLKLNSFCDMLAFDSLRSPYRYLSIYNILSHNYSIRFFFKVWISLDGTAQSITSVFRNASWYERESWDLMGIFYVGNTDLRRILNDYGFRGFPLRKDFPISGFVSVTYDYKLRSLRTRRLKMIQEFRTWNCLSPWTLYDSCNV